MGFFSPGFVIGAASSLTNQIEDAKERNAKMMERRRDQFDQLSREAKRELNRKKMTEQEYVDLAKEFCHLNLKFRSGMTLHCWQRLARVLNSITGSGTNTE
jgi:hypothetical protein